MGELGAQGEAAPIKNGAAPPPRTGNHQAMAEKSDNTALILELMNQVAVTAAQNAQIIQSQGRAEEFRKTMYEEMRKFSMVTATVERIEPVVLRLEQIRLESIGAGKLATALTRAVYAIIGAAIATVGWLASTFLGGVRHP